MPKFTRARKYQFGMFLTPGEQLLANERIVEVVTQLPPGSPTLSLRLNKIMNAQIFAPTADGQLAAHTALTFSGPPVWNLVVVPGLRLDLSVDAQGYEDTAEKELLLEQVRRRIVPNLAQLVDEGLHVNRITLIAQLQSATPEAPSTVAKAFFSEDIRKQVETGEAIEVFARRNLQATWPLDGRSIAINRIETAESIVQYAPAPERNLLNWNFDVNTAPFQDFPSSGTVVQDFYVKAVEWVDARTRDIESD